MKRKSTIITVSALTILALMITVLVIKDGDSGFALKILYYVIPFFSLAFGVYGMLRGLAKNHIWLQEKRDKMLHKSKGIKMMANLIPTFATIYGAMSISDMTDYYCVISGLLLGTVYGLASYFTTERFI